MAGADVVVTCADLEQAIAFYTGELGFRLRSISPADDPKVATLAGHDLVVRVERRGASPDIDGAYKLGRAGMRYRDLVPDRLGGRVIASHICVPQGGPVADYVHYHLVDFQLIYCYKGWVRVVYEDQGAPFVLEPGDCVLQAPGIRHRVLECSAGLEVIEVTSPAAHDTFAEHELVLPTARLAAARTFGGQRFVRHVAADATWQPWGAAQSRDLGVAAATNGTADARVVRAGRARELRCDLAVELAVVLAGRGLADGAVVVAGDCVAGGEPLVITGGSADLELLVITLPRA